MTTGLTGVAVRARIPKVVPLLALSTFVLGTSEFMIAGLLPEIATDLRITIPQAGYLISAFAIGMIVGAPAMAVLTLRMPRRITLVAALVVFVAGHVLGALAQDYTVMVVSRVVSAVATGAFWAVAGVVTVSTVGPGDRARALSVLLAGLTVANVAGVPLGTLVGQQFGWRASFWAVAALAGIGIVGVLVSVRNRDAAEPPLRIADEVAAFRRGRLWLALGTTALYQSGMIGAFSYIAPLLTDVAGLDTRWVPAVLLGFGVGALVGIIIGGRIADAHPWTSLLGALAAAAVLMCVVGLLASIPVVVVVAEVLLGAIAFIAGAPLNARVFALAGDAPTLASATNTSAFNVGNSLGPALGGIAISLGLGYTAPSWLGAVLMGAAIVLALLSWRIDRRTGSGSSR
ncbi:Cmx/CmrA family chloramphenicol efflux MFS transporter [Pseudonocardia sp. GCM10023141]|uniref:Cmx/CmrA family chloramphenicol efflux MFS transporter n=1 Tax=Pseudonocardia sp. GCM10023141 TaxID=3252653 RepID=UPI0036077D47